MDDERKEPPAAPKAEEEDCKMPAAAVAPSSDAPPKRRKIATDEVIDVVQDLNLQPGDRVEVKWTINDDDEESNNGGVEKDVAAQANAGGREEDGIESQGITVWWEATLSGKTEEFHLLTEEEKSEGASDLSFGAVPCKVPIYRLNYSPLEGKDIIILYCVCSYENKFAAANKHLLSWYYVLYYIITEFGFESHAIEDVAFISNTTLLNLSTDEIMLFRKKGEKSPPPTPTQETDVATEVEEDESQIIKEFTSRDDMGDFMNHIMQQCLKKTGMDARMKELPAAQQLHIAERIRKATVGMHEHILRRTDQMEEGEKVITAEVVHECMSQMKNYWKGKVVPREWALALMLVRLDNHYFVQTSIQYEILQALACSTDWISFWRWKLYVFFSAPLL